MRLERLAAGTTSFLRIGDGAWEPLPDDRAGAATGEDACVEAFVDGDAFLAIRVFVGATCGPA
ncbi:MAG: hypothetical protein M3245_02955 [Actinomycetota bacterium]|nr:hypothetical protein [Actinomycetota bacterium]